MIDALSNQLMQFIPHEIDLLILIMICGNLLEMFSQTIEHE